jgi:putative hemolysin
VVSFSEFCDFSPFFQKRWGKKIARIIYRITAHEKIYANSLIAQGRTQNSREFLDEIFRLFGVKTVVENPENIRYFIDNKQFITVSNHPYGTFDGMSLIRMISEERPDIKGLTNFVLSYIKPISHHFIPVNPFQKSTSKKSSLPGLRIAKKWLEEGHPLFFFPSGQVSHIDKHLKIRDREWQLSSVKFIQKANVPVIPIYFYGHNSWFFLLAGLIHPLIRSLLISTEVVNKRGKIIRLRIGEPISTEQQSHFKDSKAYGKFLYDKTYELKNKKAKE